MKNINKTIICLTLISLTEIIVTKHLGGSALLWILYGIYKLAFE